MKTITYMIIVLALSFSGCSSQKKMVTEPPFTLGEATCERWVGGRAETGSGMLLEIPILSENLDAMKLQQAYFRGMIADITMENGDKGWVAKANFRKQNAEKPDMVMHSDGKQEVGNQPPKLQDKFPFELENNECVISFLVGESLKFYKVEGIKELQQKIYR